MVTFEEFILVRAQLASFKVFFVSINLKSETAIIESKVLKDRWTSIYTLTSENIRLEISILSLKLVIDLFYHFRDVFFWRGVLDF